MKAIDVFRMCIRNLFKRKTRTFLTVLGVIIGTCAIIVMVSLGVGMDDAMDKMVSEWADLTLIQVNPDGRPRPDGEEAPVLDDDAIASFKEIAHVKAVSPFLRSLSVGYEIAIYSHEYSISWGDFVGVYMDELENFGYKLSEGRWKEDGDPSGTVLVGFNVGSYVYDYEYEEYVWPELDEEYNVVSKAMDPMTTELHIIPLTFSQDDGWWQQDFSVIGSETAPNMEYDRQLNVVGVIGDPERDWRISDSVFVDIDFLNTYIKAFNELNPDMQREEFDGTYSDVRVRVDDMNYVKDVEDQIKAMGFHTYSEGEARERMKDQVQLIQMLLAALAGVSVFIAALNITNTMITAVIERTREIGVMKVLGCDLSKIMALFLGEAAAIGFIGGVLGIGLSFGISALFNTFLFEQMMGMMSGGGGGGMSFEDGVVISQIPIWLVFGGLMFATVVGVLAGIIPAYRGTRISALSAIAYE
ncbi:MAG: ABC transporter permease [Oscillospiraceae bacterium]|nr:ABC transporter permease [Oscillospiraceae bacterium]